ncbi:MAG: septal ring lytic transglycosylase RlpA family protein [Niabella sp.]
MKKLLFIFVLLLMTRFVFGQDTAAIVLKASYYDNKFNGKRTASGTVYHHHLYTAASNVYKLGTRLTVTNITNGKAVEVIVNDRMAAGIKKRIDLSKAAFRKIAKLSTGIITVHVQNIN